MNKLINIPITQDQLKELRKLCHTPHAHPEGQNECPICEMPIIDAALKQLTENKWGLAKMKFALDKIEYQLRDCHSHFSVAEVIVNAIKEIEE